MTFFSRKITFSWQKFLMTFFLVIDQIFHILHFFPQIFPIFAMLNVIFDPFLTRKTPFLLCSYFDAHPTDNTTSLNIGGTNAWAVPSPPQIWGGPSPQFPLGLRPCPLDAGVRVLYA